VNVRVQLFALVRDLAGAPAIELSLPDGAQVADLRRALVEQVPGLQPLAAHLLFAVNAEYAGDATAVPADAEVACIPPVSGG
jgi:molybdopterin converting factor subunit 1